MTNRIRRGTDFIVCRTCGKYIMLRDAFNAGYCSEHCTTSYSQCVICHRFVPFDEVYDEHYCSPECSVHYQFLKAMGPKPVILKSEEFPHDSDDLII
ncbi:MAG: hypothetical protein JW904_14605 [Spirochaetales bacterium]|nr:hypothetical protein [Spirochaetales bacterium]